MTTPFIVAAVSDNTNSFGLYSVIMIDRVGTAFQILQNNLNVLTKGDVRNITAITDSEGEILDHDFVGCLSGVECPNQLEDAPLDVAQEAWASVK